MSDQTEFVLRQELRTLQIMNDSKSREIATQSDYVKRLQQRNKALEAALRKEAKYQSDNYAGEVAPWITEALAQLDKEDK